MILRKKISELIVKKSSQIVTDTNDLVWLLNLDMIESNTGSLIEKNYVAITEIGNSTHFFEKGTVLYSKLRPYLNKVVVADEDGFATTELVPLRCNEKLILPSYLAYLLRSPKFIEFASNVVAGAKMPRMVMSEFWDYELTIPSITEQQRILSILEKVDEIRQKRQQVIAKLDELLQSTFIDMFGDPVTNPKKWNVEKLGKHILHANNGLSRRRKESENVGHIVLRLQDVQYSGIDFNKELNRIELDQSEQERFRINKGDILFIRVNGNPDYVGRSAVFQSHEEPIFHNDHLIRIKVDDSYNPVFLSYCLNHKGGKKIISQQLKTSAGQHTISQSGLEVLEFYVPPIDIQNKFEKLLNHIKLIPFDQNKLDNLFNALQQKAFNGTL